jgi:hypothetical protein
MDRLNNWLNLELAPLEASVLLISEIPPISTMSTKPKGNLGFCCLSDLSSQTLVA